ncbi:hypothetical protein KMW28_03085 [Flammeovirga yaeyamensis]|uniref:Lipoprotein n=1 Tax=Flammeovirga yaeyamensis TaxID=367791 RepID=A0AAX1N4S9_9BACT|nr:hypothetical protein [Flammeovirga yaeyamensis]MBB3700501.1 hypothetical protein [Flammeovirga yaeyamensis]NMF36877.1 hypothetical protein [Flammeovirga yaeyamensis]QWG02574.1 hypothetical protein KMW28_03085 [Flammeovirga yaeyamensis]
MKYFKFLLLSILLGGCQLFDRSSEELGTFTYYQHIDELPPVYSEHEFIQGTAYFYFVDKDSSIISDLYEYDDLSPVTVPVEISSKYKNEDVYRVSLVLQTWDYTDELISHLVYKEVNLQNRSTSDEDHILERKYTFPIGCTVYLETKSRSIQIKESEDESTNTMDVTITGNLEGDYSAHLLIYHSTYNIKAYLPLYFFDENEKVFSVDDLKSTKAAINTRPIDLRNTYKGFARLNLNNASAELLVIHTVELNGEFEFPKVLINKGNINYYFTRYYTAPSTNTSSYAVADYQLGNFDLDYFNPLSEKELINSYSIDNGESLVYPNQAIVDEYWIRTIYKPFDLEDLGMNNTLILVVIGTNAIHNFKPLLHPKIREIEKRFDVELSELTESEKWIDVAGNYVEGLNTNIKYEMRVNIFNH